MTKAITDLRSGSNIYVLIDPRNNLIRYVGQSVNVWKRYVHHLWYARNKRRHRRDNWIFSLIKEDLLPKVEIIETVGIDEIKFWEEYYIFLFRSWGFDLTNHSLFPTNGGVSYKDGINQSQRMKAKLAADPEYAAKLKSSLELLRENKDVQERRMRNSMKVIMTEECLRRRADSLRKRFEKKFVAYLDGAFVGEWINRGDCARELNIRRSEIARCLLGMRKQYLGYTFKFSQNEIENFDRRPRPERAYNRTEERVE